MTEPAGENICDSCRSQIPEDSSGGLCPKCIVGGVLGDETAEEWLNSIKDRTGEEIGGWEITKPIGEGAFGEVYQVVHESDGREGAMKILKLGVDSREALARFDAERKALEQLDHPNITKVFEFGETGSGQPWFVMEYVDGEPVTDFCQLRKFTIRDRLEIFRTVCDAVDHAHVKGIVHRDLKPSNVLVADSEDGPVVKLIDFGIAKAIDMPLTQQTLFTHAGVLIGTPEYMSPEQASGQSLDLDERADVYSLGVLLFELLTTTTPISPARFRQAAFDEIIRLVREAEAERPSSVIRTGDKISSDLDWITLKALEKDRTRRYADSGELAADISRYLDEKPVSARKPGAIYKSKKALARNRRPALAVVAALGLVGIVALAIKGFQIREEQFAKIFPPPPEKFVPAKIPLQLPGTDLNQAKGEYSDATKNIENGPELAARLCRDLRKNPDDLRAKFRLWALLTTVQFPERIGDAIDMGSPVIGVQLLTHHNRAVALSEDGLFRSFALDTGEQKFEFSCGAGSKILAGTPRTGYAVVAGEDGTLTGFDSAKAGRVTEFSAGNSPILAVEFGFNGREFFTAQANGDLLAWSILGDGSKPIWTSSIDGAVTHLKRQFDKARIACAWSGGKCQVMETHRGEPQGPVISCDEEIVALEISHLRDEVLVVLQSGKMSVWNYRTGEHIRDHLRIKGKIRSIDTRAFRSIVAVGLENRATLRGFTGVGYKQHAVTNSPVTSIAISGTTERRFLTGHEDGTWRQWNEQKFRGEIDTVRMSRTEPISHIAISDGSNYAIAAAGNNVRMWNLQYRATRLHRIAGAGFATEAAFPPDTNEIKFLGPNGAISYQMDSFQPTGESVPIPPDSDHYALSGNGKWIAAAYYENVRLWQGSVEAKPLRIGEEITAVSLDIGTQLAVATTAGELIVWDLNSLKSVIRLKNFPENITSVAISGQRVTYGTEEGGWGVFEISTGRKLEGKTPTFSGAVDRCRFSNSGDRLAIGSRDGVARLFSLDPFGQIGDDFEFEGGVSALSFTADDQWLIIGNRLKYGTVWDARDGSYLFRSRRWSGELTISQFNPDQHWWVQSGARITQPSAYSLPPFHDPISENLLDFADGFFGLRMDFEGNFLPVSYEKFQTARKEILALPDDGTRLMTWLRWMATPADERESSLVPE